MKAKVVVFGIDGVRLDSLRTAHTPHLDGIITTGFLRKTRVPDVNPTVSGPCWATIATGVTSDEHGIATNNLHGHRLADHPCFLSRASAAGFESYAAAGWLPLLPNDATEYHGGAIFAPDNCYVPPRPPHSKTGGDDESDTLVAARAAEALRHQDIDIAFVYFGQIDHIGHHDGTGAEYLKAITQVDTHVGTVLDAITARDTYHDERWTYLAVTDHGHRDGGGHGGDSDLERTAWIAAGGADPPQPDGLGHTDIHRLALRPLGVA